MNFDDIKITYAQNREDVVIEAFLPDIQKGFYVDVGANHPLYHSVTKLFYDKGWRGINIEPNPKLFKQIKEHRPGDKNFMLGVSDKDGSLTLRVYHSRDGLEGTSTFSEEVKKENLKVENEDNIKYSDVKVETTTLSDIFSKSKVQHIHFMKIDVEGYEYEVLNGNDWKKYRPELICIESTHIVKDWRPILRKANYFKIYNDGLNDYYLSKESKSRETNFDYSQVFLLGKPVVSFDLFETLNSLNRETDRLKLALEQKQNQLLELENYISEITPLKKHIKRQILLHLSNSHKQTK